MGTDREHEKRLAAEAAAALVEDGMAVGLGTGSTAGYFVSALAARELDVRCVATSPATQEAALALGLRVEPFDEARRTRSVRPGGRRRRPDRPGRVGREGRRRRAHAREGGRGGRRPVRRRRVGGQAGRAAALAGSAGAARVRSRGDARAARACGAARRAEDARRRRDRRLDGARSTIPLELAAQLAATPGVVEHGLFPPELVS